MASFKTTERNLKTVSAGVIGNVLEWYDFALYGFFAPVISELFFPAGSHLAALLQTFGIFAVGYLMRPVGGLIFGHIGDTWGRKKALELSVLAMALPTMLLGLLPGHAEIGLAAPILLTLIRVVQGISVGGELIGSVSFLGEHSPPGRRGFLGSWTICSAVGGILIGSAVAAALTALMPRDQLVSWGWRVPFLAGILVGLVGLWLRHGIEESEVFSEAASRGGVARLPIREALAEDRLPIVITFGVTLLVSVGFYLPFVWLSTWLMTINHPPLHEALTVNTIAMSALIVLIPLFGALSDLFGRKRVILAGAVLTVVAAYPLFVVASRATFEAALTAQLCFAVLFAMVSGPSSALFVELFPTRTRYSGIALGYNAAQAIFGGTSPLIATWLISVTGATKAPAFYLMAIAATTAAAACLVREQSLEGKTELDAERTDDSHDLGEAALIEA
jgi:MHS family proline/betaine transporter-like MFS transporter